jgi:hypothetical protein
MTALLLALLGVLTLLVVGVAALALRLSARIESLEARLEASRDPIRSSETAADDSIGRLDAPEPTRAPLEYVITGLGEPEGGPVDGGVEAAPTVPAGQFADIVLRETVIRSASLFHGVRRALSPESRNRIRFEMRREVKRSRKQRRADIREARREWEARQRAVLVEERAA